MTTTATPTPTATPAPGASAGAPSTSRQQQAWLTVAIREIMVKLTDKTFIIGTISTLVLVGLGILAGILLGGQPSHVRVVVTDPEAAAIAKAAEPIMQASNDENTVTVTEVADEAAARSQVSAGDAQAYLTQVDGRWVLTWKSEPKGEYEAALGQVLQAKTIGELAQQTGTTPEEITQRMTLSSEVMQGDAQGFVGYIVGVAFAVLFMMSSMMYGMQIANSVIEEKQSRIVEILVAVIPVRQLLAGKVVGNTAIAFAQMVLLLGAGLIGIQFTPIPQFLPSLSGAIGWFLIFFLAGFLALACIWAAAGALGTRSEDLQHTSQPLMWVLMIAYFAGFMATGTVRVVLSFVPIVSSILMPVRIVDGTAAWWEPVIALAINLAFAVAMVIIGERIYRRALLRTQGRLSFRQALMLKD